MTVDEWAIRDTARDLANLYRELDALKYAPPSPRETRVMKPRPGPSTPGNWLAVALDADLVDHLVEMVCDARNHIQPAYTVGRDGATLCGWLAWNAAAVAELDFADDIHDLMQDQARRLSRRLHPPEPDAVPRPEPYQPAAAIIQLMAQRGHTITRDQLRKWAERGHITSRLRHDGRATYLLSEVVSTTRRKETHGHREH